MNEEGGFMYPMELYIDMDGRIFGSDTYRIYDLRVGECPEDGSVEGEEGGQGNEDSAAEEGEEEQGNEEGVVEQDGEEHGNEEGVVEEEGETQDNPETSDCMTTKSIFSLLPILSLSIAGIN
jgi:hypothetical protein